MKKLKILPIFLLQIVFALSICAFNLSHAYADTSTSTVVLSKTVTGTFFSSDPNATTFTATAGATPAFSQPFPVINFNPPTGTIPCSNTTNVGVNTRPFTDIVPLSDGSCQILPAQGNNQQVGVGNMTGFNAVFTSTITVSQASQVTFNFYSDDGWIMSMGASSTSAQPTYVSGPLINPPSKGPFTGYSIVGSFNQGSAPTQNNLVVNFPEAGTYPLEIDYFESVSGSPLSLTLTANGQPIPQTTGTISGHIYKNSIDPTNILSGAIVQICSDTKVCHNAITDTSGQYSRTDLPAGNYTMTAFPPSNETLLQNSIGPVTLNTNGILANQDIILHPISPKPIWITMPSRCNGQIPCFFWQQQEPVTIQPPISPTPSGCTANYQIIENNSVITEGSVAEGQNDTYVLLIPPLAPNHGDAVLSVTIKCPNTPDFNINFNIYIDPSGTVKDQMGNPIPGATVTLYRADDITSLFAPVPNGNAIMSPANRNNPDTTDSSGHFGWDVLSGQYKVRAVKTGCTSPLDPLQDYVESNILTIPPAVTGLVLTLECPQINIPPTTTAIVSPTPNTKGWNNTNVIVNLSSISNAKNSVIKQITYSATGAQPIAKTTINNENTTISITTEGQTTISFYATDNFGNQETPKTVTVKIDKTAPEISIKFDPKTQKFVGSATDALSGIAAFNQTATTMTAEDNAGNATQLKFTTLGENIPKNMRIGTQTITVNKLIYNGHEAPIPETTLIANWQANKDNTITHLMQADTITGQESILGTYNSNNNKTTIIDIIIGKKTQKTTKQGLDVINLSTNKGKLQLNF